MPSLEEALTTYSATTAANTAAMVALTAALLGKPPGAAAGAAGSGKTGPKTPPKAAEPVHTFEEVTTACVRVKNEKGAEAAQALIKDVGGTEKLKDVSRDKFDALFAAAEAAVAVEEIDL